MHGPYSRNLLVRDPVIKGPIQLHDSAHWWRSDTPVHIAPLPYSRLVTRWMERKTAVTGGMDTESLSVGYYVANGYKTRSNISGSSIQAVHNKCYSKWLNKATSGVSLANDLAEYAQTRAMMLNVLKGLRNPLAVLANTFHRYAATQPKKLPKHLFKQVVLKDIPGAWLAFHFGVEPLIKDLYALFERYNFKHPPRIVTSTSKGSWRYDNLPGGNYVWQEMESWNALVRISAWVDTDKPLMANLAQFGFLNPASVAWELTPLSFVVDWFYPVGQLIASMTDLVGLKISNTYRTWMLKGIGAIRYVQPSLSEWRKLFGMRYERFLDVPAPKVQPFRFPQQFSNVRLATALAVTLGVIPKNGSKPGLS